MIYFLALIPATALTVAGYVALFLSSRSEGGLRAFGRYLGFWAFTLAGLVILGAIFAAAHGHRGGGPGHYGMRGMHAMPPGMFRPWSREHCPPPPPAAPGAHPGEEGAGAPSPSRPAGPAGDSAPQQH